MTNSSAIQRSLTSVRACGLIVGTVVGLQSVWLIAAELVRPSLPFFLKNDVEAHEVGTRVEAAKVAAWLGWPRGSLWVDYAIADSSAPFASKKNKNSLFDEEFLVVANRAAALSPSDARAWLLLADATIKSTSNNREALDQLRMSYYTSPYNDELFPLRIQVVVQIRTAIDSEVSGYAEYELNTALKHRSNSKYAIERAYTAATPTGRQWLNLVLGRGAPEFLAELKTRHP